MRVVGALYGGPNTSNPAPGHKVHPSLLRKPAATRPDRVRIMDMVVRTGEEAHTDLLFLATADAIHRRASCRECPVQAAAENPDCVPMRTEKYLAGLERAGAEQESPAVRQPETRHLQLGAFAAQDRKGS